jgi:hypothetical protein
LHSYLQTVVATGILEDPEPDAAFELIQEILEEEFPFQRCGILTLEILNVLEFCKDDLAAFTNEEHLLRYFIIGSIHEYLEHGLQPAP